MSTPNNKRDARREARKASLADAQTARAANLPGAADGNDSTLSSLDAAAGAARAAETPTPELPHTLADDGAAESATVVSASTQAPASATASTPLRKANGAQAGASKPITRPTGTGPATKTPTRPTTGVPGTKTPTRPTGTAGARVSTGGMKTPTTPVGTARPTTRPTANASTGTKTPTRPTNTGTLAGNGARAAGAAATYRPPARGEVTTTDESDFKTKRDSRREERLASISRVRNERQLALRKKKQRAMTVRYGTIGGIALGVILLAVLFGLWLHSSSNARPYTSIPSAGYGQGITCDSNEQTAVHYHADLQIIVNGKAEAVPQGIGFGPNPTSPTCLYWLHTHDTSGVLHIEAPQSAANRAFVLGDFFYVWQQNATNTIALGQPSLTATSFFGQPIDSSHPLHVFVDGKPYTGDPNKIVLKDHENIWLEYGTPIVTPTPYNFSAAGL